jgi:hypothetical protein
MRPLSGEEALNREFRAAIALDNDSARDIIRAQASPKSTGCRARTPSEARFAKSVDKKRR